MFPSPSLVMKYDKIINNCNKHHFLNFTVNNLFKLYCLCTYLLLHDIYQLRIQAVLDELALALRENNRVYDFITYHVLYVYIFI